MDRVPRYEMRLTIAAVAAIAAPRVFAYSRLPGTGLVSGYAIDLKLPGVSPYTTIPSSLSAKLRLGGRSALRIFGRYTQIAMVAYGLALATIEAHCSGHCCGIRQYDPSVGNIYDQMYRYLDDMFRDSRGETYGVGL